MDTEETTWRNYEEVAVYLLDRIGSELGLKRVEGKQKLVGTSGLAWEIDGKGVRMGDEGIVVIECRCHNRKLTQEQMAALAFRMKDLGGVGGIAVSPLGHQAGAKKLAEAQGIEEVHLDEKCTRTDYFLEFLNRAFVGASDTITVQDDAKVFVAIEANGEA
ncbi:restriction endonuclease [Gordonia amicalis]|uniref:restriction endonuclease n=1 Tax=Gordonia amicalis TaxID=89053 RepID=UPI0002A627F8|nr:hypothetical protein [Gordonia amicalis]NKX78660.1 hypothetical protein [Gordonia amicalis]GAC55541.1 hypothetical protein GOAMI_57_00080 [Gordonia amicalis NBRC 100051 = JCM 11271]